VYKQFVSWLSVAEGLTDFISANTPLINGVAIDVPDNVAEPARTLEV